MADNFYTAHDLQRMLGVDRTTVYRMADAGRLPAVKVGRQWRFPRRHVDLWLQNPAEAPAQPEALTLAPSGQRVDLRQVLPVECIQLMQDTFADALGVTILMTDLEGQPVTRTSNPCGYHEVIAGHPTGHAACLSWWADLSRSLALQPTFVESPMGLLCARAFFRADEQLMGMVVLAGIAPQEWPPSAARLEQIASLLGMEADDLEEQTASVIHADVAEQQRLLLFAQRLADIVTHIISERRRVRTTLASIAALTDL